MKKKNTIYTKKPANSLEVNEAAIDYAKSTNFKMEVYRNPVDSNVRSMYFMGLNSQKNIINTKVDYINLIRKGLPKKSLDKLMDITDFTVIEMAAIVHTTDRTLRRYTDEQKLNPEQSERIIELANLYARGEEVFENLDNFKKWMDTSILALGNKKPKDFLDTSIGIELLMDELGRIQHGVFA